MGQKFGKAVETDGVGDRSGAYEQCTAAPSDIDHHSPVRFEKLRDMHRRRAERISVQGLTLSEMEILNTPLSEDPDHSDAVDRLLYGLDLDSDAVQNPVASKSVRDEEIRPAQAHIESAGEEDIQQSSVSLSEEKLEDDETSNGNMQEINSCMYAVGEMLAASANGLVYAGTRVQDGLEVALKRVHTSRHLDYISIPGHPEPLPREVALHMLACEDGHFPVIVQLLDWQEHPDHYIMVLERPSPCEGLNKFIASQGGVLNEELAKQIMWQVSVAAFMCCEQGVFHRNITLENLLITTDTMDVKLIGFGCGDLLKKSTYNTFTGTREYVCPEFLKTGKYYGKPATVYSLGVLLFAMLCGKYPSSNDRVSINERIWSKDGLTEECCRLVEDCLQEDPEKRIDLEKIYEHDWFRDKDPADDLQTLINSGSHDQSRVFHLVINDCQYEIGRKLGQGGFGSVYRGTRLQDVLKVAVKFVRKTAFVEDYINIPGYSHPFPREVGLQMLACAGENVPVIVQLLDWQETSKFFLLVLERPSPCMDVSSFVAQHGGTVTENIARRILSQAAEAAEVCCRRGVFHRDIKLQNLLINPNTLEVKLIDFGCGDLLKSSTYNTYIGTWNYASPEWHEKGRYHGKPATVYSLGVLLYVLLCGKFPGLRDRFLINEWFWNKEGLTQECCRFVVDCLQEKPEKRIDLERIRYHEWFQDKDPADDLQTPVPSGSHDVVQFPDDSGSNPNGHVDILILHTSDSQSHTSDSQSHTSDSQSEEKLEDDEESSMFVLVINDCQYEIGRKLGQGGFGSVYEGTRVQDGLKVAVKYVDKTKSMTKDYIYIPGYPKSFPREVGLHLLARKGDNVPVIVQLLDWQDYPEQYVMVLELPSPCEDVRAFVNHNGGTISEVMAQTIFRQAAEAAQVCCKQGVFHRDITMSNLLINTDTLEVKLIDFGCGDLLRSSTYNSYMGTNNYTCLYHGKPATVYSLGVLLFAMVCGKYPSCLDLQQIDDKKWSKDGLTAECRGLIQACLQRNPDKRIHLGKILEHAWF